MDTRWYEIMAQCMHLHQRRHTNSITKIVRINTLGQAGAGHRLSSQEARLQSFFESLADEGEGKSCIVTAAAYASNDHIRIIICAFQLEQRLFADHRLVHQYMVKHTSQRVLGRTAALGSNFYRLTDRDTQATHILRVLRQDAASCVRQVSRAGMHGRAIGFHQITAIGLLLVADFHHENFDFHVEKCARHC